LNKAEKVEKNEMRPHPSSFFALFYQPFFLIALLCALRAFFLMAAFSLTASDQLAATDGLLEECLLGDGLMLRELVGMVDEYCGERCSWLSFPSVACAQNVLCTVIFGKPRACKHRH